MTKRPPVRTFETIPEINEEARKWNTLFTETQKRWNTLYEQDNEFMAKVLDNNVETHTLLKVGMSVKCGMIDTLKAFLDLYKKKAQIKRDYFEIYKNEYEKLCLKKEEIYRKYGAEKKSRYGDRTTFLCSQEATQNIYKDSVMIETCQTINKMTEAYNAFSEDDIDTDIKNIEKAIYFSFDQII